MTHVIFIPWSRARAAAACGAGIPLAEAAADWARKKPAKFAADAVVCTDSEARLPASVNGPAERTIYVIGGACAPGAAALVWNGEAVGFEGVADALVAAGLRRTFRGKIKIWSSDSGAPEGFGQAGAAPGEAEAMPFAARFARYLRDTPPAGHGVSGAQVFGYVGQVTPTFRNANRAGEDAASFAAEARAALLTEGDEWHRYAGPEAASLSRRGKDARRRF